MSILRAAGRALLLNRLLRDNRRQRHYGSRSPYGYPRRRRDPSGFRMRGPFPTYSRRTRRGSRVTVSGCCLPIPLALTVAGSVGLGRFVRSR